MTDFAAGTSGVSNSSQSSYSTSQAKDKSILDKDSFLRLLITQLANQDPTNPVEDREFISQMAQFSALEQMNNVASELRGLRQMFGLSSNLIGKVVEWKVRTEDGIKHRTGVVDSIVLREGEPIVVVGDEEIPFTDVVRVSQAPSEGGESPPDGENPGDGSESEDGEEA